MMAKFTIKNRSRNCVTMGPISIRRGKEADLNTDSLCDKSLFSLSRAVNVGILSSTVSAVDLANLIKDTTLKTAALKMINGKDFVFEDVTVAQVIIDEIVETKDEVVDTIAETIETVKEVVSDFIEDVAGEQIDQAEAVAETISEAVEETVEAISDSYLENILEGTVKEIREALANRTLTAEEADKLIELEQAGKNRSTVLDMIIEGS